MKREWTHDKLTKLWALLLTADRLLACTARPVAADRARMPGCRPRRSVTWPWDHRVVHRRRVARASRWCFGYLGRPQRSAGQRRSTVSSSCWTTVGPPFFGDGDELLLARARQMIERDSSPSRVCALSRRRSAASS